MKYLETACCQKEPSIQFITDFNIHFIEIFGFPVLLEGSSAWQSLVLNSSGLSGLKSCKYSSCSVFSPSRIPVKHNKPRAPVYRVVFRVEVFLINLSKGLEKSWEDKGGVVKDDYFFLLLLLLDKTQPAHALLIIPHPVATYQPSNPIMEMVWHANENHLMTQRKTIRTIVSR